MTAEKIIILGAGYTGVELARQARERGLSVICTTRDKDRRRALEELGAEVVEWSHGEDLGPWLSRVDESTAVVYSVPTLFREVEEGSDGSTEGRPRHVEPVAEVAEAAAAAGAKRFLYLSSTSVYGDQGGAWIDEKTPRVPVSPVGVMRRDIEDFLYNDFGPEWPEIGVTVARLVGIYGPGRSLVERLKGGRFRLVDGGRKVTNRIHVEDIGAILLAILAADPEGVTTYNLSDGHPQRVRDLVEFVCTELGMPLPPEESLEDYAERRNDPNVVARWRTTSRVRNDRIRTEVGVTLKYPDAFAGYRSILGMSDGSVQALAFR